MQYTLVAYDSAHKGGRSWIVEAPDGSTAWDMACAHLLAQKIFNNHQEVMNAYQQTWMIIPCSGTIGKPNLTVVKGGR